MGDWGKLRALGRPWGAPGGALGLLRESERNIGVWGANRGTEGYSGRFLGRLRITRGSQRANGSFWGALEILGGSGRAYGFLDAPLSSHPLLEILDFPPILHPGSATVARSPWGHWGPPPHVLPERALPPQMSSPKFTHTLVDVARDKQNKGILDLLGPPPLQQRLQCPRAAWGNCLSSPALWGRKIALLGSFGVRTGNLG